MDRKSGGLTLDLEVRGGRDAAPDQVPAGAAGEGGVVHVAVEHASGPQGHVELERAHDGREVVPGRLLRVRRRLDAELRVVVDAVARTEPLDHAGGLALHAAPQAHVRRVLQGSVHRR